MRATTKKNFDKANTVVHWFTEVFALSKFSLTQLFTFLCSCAANQANAGEEENRAYNHVNEGRLRYATFGEINTAINEANQTDQRQDDAENAFNVHALSFYRE